MYLGVCPRAPAARLWGEPDDQLDYRTDDDRQADEVKRGAGGVLEGCWRGAGDGRERKPSDYKVKHFKHPGHVNKSVKLFLHAHARTHRVPCSR